jgi:two-component system, response regulator YesN
LAVPSLLLVDDDLALLGALSRFLADSGFQVVPCSTFEDAKREIGTLRPEIVVTDVRLGAFNGLQLALLARDVRADVRVVVFSGFDDPVLKEEARRIGATYLIKPVSGHALVSALRSAESG